jgi:hypothetical protein
VKSILAADCNPADWEGDQPEYWQGEAADPEMERNGGYIWLDRGDIESAIGESHIDECWGHAMAEFWMALGVTVTDENYSRP